MYYLSIVFSIFGVKQPLVTQVHCLSNHIVLHKHNNRQMNVKSVLNRIFKLMKLQILHNNAKYK